MLLLSCVPDSKVRTTWSKLLSSLLARTGPWPPQTYVFHQFSVSSGFLHCLKLTVLQLVLWTKLASNTATPNSCLLSDDLHLTLSLFLISFHKFRA